MFVFIFFFKDVLMRNNNKFNIVNLIEWRMKKAKRWWCKLVLSSVLLLFGVFSVISGNGPPCSVYIEYVRP